MSKHLIINGLPDRLRLDGWWLDATTTDADGTPSNPPPQSSPATAGSRGLRGLLGLALLVLIADVLFWHHAPGLSLAIFALLLSAAMLAAKPDRPSPQTWVTVLGLELICNLPVIEQVQLLSVLFSLAGLIGLAAWVALGRLVDWGQSLRIFLRISTIGAAMLGADAVRRLDKAQVRSSVVHQASALLLPMTVGLVFLLLLTAANPVLQRLVEQIDLRDLLDPELFWRALFWCIAASLIWPYLHLDQGWLGGASRPPKVSTRGRNPLAVFVNPASVRNSLVLFNLLFMIQTVMDIGVLTGGMTLPDGMSFATYAHRGAYPLVVTALLAGVFAITTRHMIGDNVILRGLVFLWLGQNMLLVLSAAFRLGAYVEAYALTQLRLAAFIWMALVLVGLCLTVVQIVRHRDNAWLVRSNLLVLAGTLYLCCFVNFAQVIAGYNLRHHTSLARLDTAYVCRLGEQALPMIDAFEATTGRLLCGPYGQHRPVFAPIRDWREWGFRKWRLQRYLDANKVG